MECLRRVVDSNDLISLLSLPRSFLNKKVEIFITPVDDNSKSDSTKLIENCINDARCRYKIANGKKCNVVIPSFLLNQLYKINFEETPLISIRDGSAKITMFYKGKKNIIDYNFDFPDRVIISSFKNEDNKRIMDMSELKIEKLSGYFGA